MNKGAMTKRAHSCPKVIQLFHAQLMLSIKFIVLINVKMPTIFGIQHLLT